VSRRIADKGGKTLYGNGIAIVDQFRNSLLHTDNLIHGLFLYTETVRFPIMGAWI